MTDKDREFYKFMWIKTGKSKNTKETKESENENN